MPLPKVYEQHEKSFPRVSAYAVLKGGEHVATIAFKFPKDGAGRLYAYFHWIGLEMIRGHANGYGYDKRSAAIESAIAIMAKENDFKTKDKVFGKGADDFTDLIRHLKNIGGSTWDTKLRDAGFQVCQAV